MTQTAQVTQEKQRHYGFSIVPRLVMRHERFAKLTDSAKWLYTCLKDICGDDDGECFYSLRNLEDLIHISVSTLSRGIDKLIKAGLIVAQKIGKKSQEIFHIKIVNVWDENDATYKSCFKMKQVETEAVSKRNGPFQNETATDDDQAQSCFILTYKEESILRDESSKKTEDITFTIVKGDELRPYIDGYVGSFTLPDLECDAEDLSTPAQEAKLYTSSPHVDIVSHSHSHESAIGDEEEKDVVAYLLEGETHPRFEEMPAPPARKRMKANKPKAAPPAAPPAIQLTEQQQAFWLLWCDVWFNQDIPPELNETAYKHVKKLAPHIRTKEQLESLTAFARKELEQNNIKRKHIFLGNLVSSYSGWKQ